MRPKFSTGFPAILSLAFLLLFLAGCDRKQASDYNDDGNTKQSNGDLPGAIDDYTRAIALDPGYAPPYYNRGNARAGMGDVEGSIADLDRAIGFDPKNSNAYFDRGDARHFKGDLDGAIADLNHAIELAPKNASVYDSLGNALQTKGDPDAAMAAFNSAIELDPKNPYHYLYRGVAKARLRQWPDALADLRQCCELPGDDDVFIYQDYARLFIWLTRARQGDADAASKELTASLATRQGGAPGDWYTKLAGFLTGTISEPDMLAAASVPDKAPNPDQQCEAWFYAGMKKLIAGDKAAAADDFHKCLATGRRASEEYQLALSELKALGE